MNDLERPVRLDGGARFGPRFSKPLFRYLFGLLAVAIAFALRTWLQPLTGTGAPFVLFFAAILLTSLFAGAGPALCALLLTLPLGAYPFVERAGYSLRQAAFQSLLFAADGLAVVYLTHLADKVHLALTDVNRRLLRANEEITRSEARTRDLIEFAPDGLFLADLDGRFTDVNRAAAKLLGYTREELIGRTIADIVPEEDAPRILRVSGELRRGGTQIAEWTQRHKDGTLIPVEVSTTILEDGRWQAFVRDIRERKRVEEERQVFVSLLENSFDFIGIADPSGKPVYINPAGRRMVGFPADVPVEQTRMPDYYPPEQRSFATEMIIKSMIERGRWSGETYLRNWQTGERIPVSDEHFMIRDSRNGRVIGMGTIIRDITERRRIEREQQFLDEAGAALGATLDYEQTLATVARLVVRDLADWCIVEVVEERDHLRRLKVVSGDPEKTPLCADLEQVPLDRDRPYLLRSMFEKREPVLIERLSAEYMESVAQGPEHLRMLLALGGVSFMAVPLLMRGQLLGALAFISSNPSRIYGQGHLRVAEALGHRAAGAIENARLYRASMAAIQLRDQVLGIVAHDLRNPMSAILMQVTTLERSGLEHEPRLRRPMAIIHRAAIRMNRLVQDLLDVAMMEAGKLAVERVPLSVGELVVEVVDMQRPLVSSSSLELRLELEGDVQEVWGDRDRLLQVFENLIGNAIKFTKAGGRISVGAASKGDEVVFWVADTGRGIASEDVPRVFDRFWQATKAGHLGAGLGLSITKGIIEAHGGRIWVESALDQGTTFFFTIPRAFPAEERPADMKR